MFNFQETKQNVGDGGGWKNVLLGQQDLSVFYVPQRARLGVEN